MITRYILLSSLAVLSTVMDYPGFTTILHLLLISPTLCRGGREGLDPGKSSPSYYSQQWTSTGEVPNKLAQAPPAPLFIRYNNKPVYPNDVVRNEDMNHRPKFMWESEPGALYTIMQLDFGIERLMGAQYFHWMVANIQDPTSINNGIADEVRMLENYLSCFDLSFQIREYIPPFSFEVNPGPPPTLDMTTGKPIHDILTLVYKQRDGRV